MILPKYLVKEFYSKGYILIENFFDHKLIAPLIEDCDKLFKLTENKNTTWKKGKTEFIYENNTLQRIVWACDQAKEIDKVALNKKLIDVVSAILENESIVQIICQYHIKTSYSDLQFEWHQDAHHRRYGTKEWNDIDGRGSFVQTFLALEDIDELSGGLDVIPFSSQWGHVETDKFEEIKELFEESPIETISMKKGDLLLFHPFTVHRSQKNQNQKDRKALINGYCHQGANLRNYPGCGLGRIINHRDGQIKKSA